jgi:hypothetical protein
MDRVALVERGELPIDRERRMMGCNQVDSFILSRGSRVLLTFFSSFGLATCNRRAILVKALMRGLGLMFLIAILLGLTGCGTDNESESEKLQKSAGTPPPVPEGSQPTSTPKISTREDYGKNYKNPLEGTKYSPGRRK